MHFVIQDSFIFILQFFITGTCMTNELKIKPMSCGLFFYWLKVKNVEKKLKLLIMVHILQLENWNAYTLRSNVCNVFFIFIRVSKTIVNILRDELSRCFILNWYSSWFVHFGIVSVNSFLFLTSVCLQHIQYKDPPHPMTNCFSKWYLQKSNFLWLD